MINFQGKFQGVKAALLVGGLLLLPTDISWA